MIDFELKPEINTSETQRMVFEAARDFASQYILPNVMDWDEAQYFPKEIFEKATTTNRGRFDINNHDFHLIPRIDMGKNLSLFKIFLKLETLYEDINFKKNELYL